MSAPASVQAIGECMVELLREDSGTAQVAYSGDTYNTAVYLRRVASQLAAQVQVQYLTGVGDDDESEQMQARWRADDIVDDSIVVPGAAPGIYLISTDDDGERSFTYWRHDSAATRLLTGIEWIDRVDGDLIFVSGISLQLMSAESRAALVARLSHLRQQGTRVAFDSNYRASAWDSAAEAREAMDAVLTVTDIALVTLADEIELGGCHDLASCVEHLTGSGIAETVVKGGPDGAWVVRNGEIEHVATSPVEAVDTTGAGDSFNGGYLAARLAGRDVVEAATVGNRVAHEVVQQRGAIIDESAMPPVV